MNTIIRRSKVKTTLFLLQTIEKVYKVFYNGVENFNGLDYDEVSNVFDEIEKGIRI